MKYLLLVAVIALTGCDQIVTPARLKQAEDKIALLEFEVSRLNPSMKKAEDRISILEAQISQLSINKAPTAPAHYLPDATRLEVAKQAISKCVQVARDSAPKDELNAKFYQNFDAFYNPSSGQVQNNVIYNGGMPALFSFNKCMTERGYPLGK